MFFIICSLTPFLRIITLLLHFSIDNDILLLYGLTVLRFYKDFESCMAEDEPRNYWSGTKLHPFVHRVQEAMSRCDITVDAFEQWQTDVKASFKARNA